MRGIYVSRDKGSKKFIEKFIPWIGSEVKANKVYGVGEG